MLCTQHYQRFDEEVGCCWKCVAAERDPHNTACSWWWHLEPQVPAAADVEEANRWLRKVA